MSKGSSGIEDFPIAPRRARKAETGREPENGAGSNSPQGAEGQEPPATGPQPPVPSRSNVILPTPEARKERATAKALEQETSRLRLQDLKQKRARESKHYVNCALDYDTKKRLERAASENDVKMTVIVKAAIDQFLRDNGY